MGFPSFLTWLFFHVVKFAPTLSFNCCQIIRLIICPFLSPYPFWVTNRSIIKWSRFQVSYY